MINTIHNITGVILKNIIFPLLIVLLVALISGCETDAQNSGDIKLETQKDSISYFIGSDISRSLKDIKEEVVKIIIFQIMGICLNMIISYLE